MAQKLNTHKAGKTVVGLTGTFGSGKSTVSAMFGDLGAAVINADELAHDALEKGSPVHLRIKEFFEDCIDATTGQFDRKKLAGVIFHDAAKRQQLEAIVHPYVFEKIAELIATAEQQNVIIEIPLLYETGFEPCCQKIVVVSAQRDVINQRLKEKGFSEEEIERRTEAQMPLEEKVKKADYVINNSKDTTTTQEETKNIWNQITASSKGAMKDNA